MIHPRPRINGDLESYNLTDQAKPVIERHENDVLVHKKTGPEQTSTAVAGQKSPAVYPNHDRHLSAQVWRVNIQIQAVLLAVYYFSGRSEEVIVLDTHIRFFCTVQNSIPWVDRRRRLKTKIIRLLSNDND